MANYCCTARTSYFAVKDEAAFREWIGKTDLDLVEKEDKAHPGVKLFAVLDTGGEGFPSSVYDENDNEVDFDFIAGIAQYLAEGWWCVYMESGAEKLRYVTGVAMAIKSDGQTIDVQLSDIYRELGWDPNSHWTECTY